jgi:hypothetical protein
LLAGFAAVEFQAQSQAQAVIVCSSKPGERQHCEADTSGGVLLQRSTGDVECLLGRTWGYDDKTIWVADGCSGEFASGQAAPRVDAPSDQQPIESWGAVEPGKGFLVGKTELGDLYISTYALVRYLNQLPPDQTFVDHLGNERPVDTRNDIYAHRIMVFLKGWMGLPKLRYQIIIWTVNTTDQDAIFAVLGYQFGRRFSLYAGLNALPGTRTLQGSHPYWLGHDRVMADEFFRPYFTNGVWASGEVAPGLWYLGMAGNNLSALGITARQLTRDLATAGSVWWMPTTKEFGPQGAFGDWEQHDQLATRFGISTTRSREDRFSNVLSGAPDNTTIRLADSLNLFDTGSLAPGVTVQTADYRLLAFDAGLKYRGIFLQTEIYHRWLKNFVADGPLPVTSIKDKGFYVLGAFFPIPKTL